MAEGKLSLKLHFTNPVLLEMFFPSKVERKEQLEVFYSQGKHYINMSFHLFFTWIRFMSLIKIWRVCKILLNSLWQAIPNLSLLGYRQLTLYR